MKTITPGELKSWLDRKTKFTLVDVRETWERTNYNIGGLHIPLAEVMQRKNELDKKEVIVVYCEKGIRSAIIIQRLETYGYDNIYNLEGGMTAWKKSGYDKTT